MEQNRKLSRCIFHSRSLDKKVSKSTNIISHLISPSVKSNTHEKRKGIQTGKEEVKLALFTDNMTLQIEKPKDYTHILYILELISEYSKVAGCNINIQKLVVFQYNNNNPKRKLRK